MANKAKAIIVLLSAALLCACGMQPVINSEPEHEKIQIIGQIDGATDAAQAVLITPTPAVTLEPANTTTATPAPIHTAEPTPTPTEAPTEMPAPTATPTPDRTKAEQLCNVARSLIEAPYARGGTTPEGFDPGGFVYYCLNKVGVKVRHKTSKGYSEYEAWQRIDAADDLVPGDLCFYRTGDKDAVNCVCIYLGDGQMIYPSSSKGAVIIKKSTGSYWTEAFAFARRVF